MAIFFRVLALVFLVNSLSGLYAGKTQEKSNNLTTQLEYEYGSPYAIEALKKEIRLFYINYLRNNSYGSTFVLPKSLEKLPVVHLEAQQQLENSCGYRSVINAKAIQELVNENKAITSSSIAQYAKKYNHLLQDRELYPDELTQLATTLNLENFFIINKSQEPKYSGYFSWITSWFRAKKQPFISIDSHKPFHIGSVNTLLRRLQNKEQWAVPFLCYTSFHWVTIVIVKESGKNPVLMYLNSVNSPLTNDYPATGYLKTMYEEFIKPNLLIRAKRFFQDSFWNIFSRKKA